MGRAPCCDKANVKRGPWSPEEDAKLKSYIESHGTGGNWIALPPKIGLKRCGKSCRLRWLNYLRPNIKHGGFTEDEDNLICTLYITIGSRWSIIAGQLPGRTDNDIKNYWNTRLKKKLIRRHQRHQSQSKKQPQNYSINDYNHLQLQQISPPTLDAAAAGMLMPAALEEAPFLCNNLQSTSLVGLNTIDFHYTTCDALTTTDEEDQQPLCANSGLLMNSSANARFMDANSLQQIDFRAFDGIHERLPYRMPQEMDGLDNLFDMSPALTNYDRKTEQNWAIFDQPRLLGYSE